MNILYDDMTGKVIGVQIGNTSIPKNRRNRDWRKFVAENKKSETPLDIDTPLKIEKPEPDPTPAEKIAALEAMVKRLSGETKQTTEEIDLMVKTGLITEDTAATMKAEA